MVGEVKEQEIEGSWMVMSLHPFTENHVHKITATLYIQPCKYPCHKANNHRTGVHIILRTSVTKGHLTTRKLPQH